MEEQSAQTRQDPVCGMQVKVASAKFTSKLNGDTYYFCSPACKKQFDANPDKYLMHIH